MAAFIKAQDPHQHLVATSSDTDIAGLYDTVDYVQPHSYPPDAVTMAASLEPGKWNKPIFFGEVGPSGGDNRLSDSAYEDFLHAALWASIMQSDTGGAAQFWYWDQMERQNLYSQYQSVTGFLKATSLATFDGMKNIVPSIATAETGAVSLGPGGGWGAAKQTDFVVSPSGDVPVSRPFLPSCREKTTRTCSPGRTSRWITARLARSLCASGRPRRRARMW
jgi:hypothetical protein